MGVDGREVNVLGYMQFLMSTHKKKMFVQKLKKNCTTLGPYKNGLRPILRPIK